MAALWLVVLIGVTSYELSVRSRTRRLGIANALEMTQAAAAAEAGLETVRAVLDQRLSRPLESRTVLVTGTFDRWSDLGLLGTDTIRLGGARAITRVYDAGSRLQLNRATEADVRRLLIAMRVDASQADQLAHRILDWRDRDQFRRARGAERADYLRSGARALPSDEDFAEVNELREVDGMTPALYERLAPLLCVHGTGQINLNSAPRAVLASLPGLGDEAIAAIVRSQASRRPLQSLEELLQRLSPSARRAIVDASSDLMSRMTFETREVIVEAEGWLDGSPVRANGEAVFVKAGDALSTSWRRVGT